MFANDSQGLKSPKTFFYIEEDALRKMKAAAQIADRLEIGGFGFVEKRQIHGDEYYVVFDIMLPHQTVAPGGQDFTPMDAIDYRVDNDYPADSLRFSWHTHGRGTPFWSNIDEGWIAKMGDQGLPWVFSLVADCNFNQVQLRLDVFEPFRLVNGNVEMVELVTGDVYDEMEDLIDRLVTVGRTTAEDLNEVARSSKDIKVVMADDGEEIRVIGANVDLDGVYSEAEAAAALADVGDDESDSTDSLGSETEVTIVRGDLEELDETMKGDPEDAEQDRIVKELERGAEMVCANCERPLSDVGAVCPTSEDGRHNWVRPEVIARGNSD